MGKRSELQQAIDAIEEDIKLLMATRDRLVAVRKAKPTRSRKGKQNDQGLPGSAATKGL